MAKISTKKLESLNAIKDKLFDNSFYNLLGEEVRGRIVERTKKGIDKDGKKFEPYSESYGFKRRKVGKSLWPVNLTFTGKMLKSLKVKAKKDSVTIGFDDNDQYNKANYVENGSKVKRKFMGLTDGDKIFIVSMTENHILRKLRKAGY